MDFFPTLPTATALLPPVFTDLLDILKLKHDVGESNINNTAREMKRILVLSKEFNYEGVFLDQRELFMVVVFLEA